MTQGVPTPIDPAIENDIVNASTTGLAAIAAPGRPVTETSHVIKYTTAEFGGGYPPAPKALAMPGSRQVRASRGAQRSMCVQSPTLFLAASMADAALSRNLQTRLAGVSSMPLTR
jgi:hypothetical protein